MNGGLPTSGTLHPRRLLLHGRRQERPAHRAAGLRSQLRQRRRLLPEKSRSDLEHGEGLPWLPGFRESCRYSRRYAFAARPVSDSTNQNDPGFQYCTGDNLFGTVGPTKTTYTVLKATVPGDPHAVTTQVQSDTVFPPFLPSGTNKIADQLKRGQPRACSVRRLLPAVVHAVRAGSDGRGVLHSRCRPMARLRATTGSRFTRSRHPAPRLTPPLPATRTWASTRTSDNRRKRSSTSLVSNQRRRTTSLELNFFDIGDAPNRPDGTR